MNKVNKYLDGWFQKFLGGKYALPIVMLIACAVTISFSFLIGFLVNHNYIAICVAVSLIALAVYYVLLSALVSVPFNLVNKIK